MQPITAAAHHQASSQDASPSPERVVPVEAIELVRAVFRAWVLGAVEDPELRRALRLFCDAAQRQQLRSEQVLVALKSMFRAVPEISNTRKRDSSNDLIARAVTMCIEEYYAAPADRRQRSL
jgi:hypothetical protein